MHELAKALQLPIRPDKPRDTGMCSVLDSGMATQAFQDMIESHGHLIDWVKLGWGTALVTRDIRKKIDLLSHHGIAYYFGGTLFEKAVQRNAVEAFYKFVTHFDAQWIEISDGTLDIPQEEKLHYIQQASQHFQVLSEVGFKDPDKSEAFYPSEWISAIQLELQAGAVKCVTEARESGRSGICRPNGEIRVGLIREILNSSLNPQQLIFETPNKSLQAFFIQQVGPNVNLGNIALQDIVSLETLRLGLRSDTFHMPIHHKSLD